MFRIEGTRSGHVAWVVWTDGRLDGDAVVVADALALVRSRTVVPVQATGPAIVASLRTPEDAVVTLGNLFDAGYRLTGDEPLPVYPVEPLPDGFVA